MTPVRTSTTTTTGTSKARPNARNMPRTKLKYASMSGATEMLFGANAAMNSKTRPNTTK